jgi:hypothetical protein
MAVYRGALPAGAGVQFVTMCFTGWEAMLFRWLIREAQVGGSVLVWGAAGFVASFIFGPEVLPQIVGVAAGATAGAIGGTALSIWTLAASGCACPPGSDGFCVAAVLFVVPGTPVVMPVYPFFLPDRGGCTTVMPPGCP